MIRTQRIASYKQFKNLIPSEHWSMLQSTLSAESDTRPDVNLFVAEIDGHIAGSIVLFPSKAKAYEWDNNVLEYPEIRMLAVNPKFRENGVGKALVRHCIDVAKEHGEKRIGLHTGSFMADAMKLYEGIGFERMPELDFEPLNDGIIVLAYQLAI